MRNWRAERVVSGPPGEQDQQAGPWASVKRYRAAGATSKGLPDLRPRAGRTQKQKLSRGGSSNTLVTEKQGMSLPPGGGGAHGTSMDTRQTQNDAHWLCEGRRAVFSKNGQSQNLRVAPEASRSQPASLTGTGPEWRAGRLQRASPCARPEASPVPAHTCGHAGHLCVQGEPWDLSVSLLIFVTFYKLRAISK